MNAMSMTPFGKAVYTPYTKAFYAGQVDASRTAAEIILGLLFPMIGTPKSISQINPRSHLGLVKSVCDVGCGTGCWLDVAQSLGTWKIFGFDGDWARESLIIPEKCFFGADLNELVQSHSSGRFVRYDLAMCLETAEHLEPESSEPLVRLLTELSDVVLFSAAIPGQGGTGHVNEQWTGYWVKLFAERGFACYDVIRPEIWEDERIPFWYRQNTLVFINCFNEPSSFKEMRPSVMTIVHPELYMQRNGFFR